MMQKTRAKKISREGCPSKETLKNIIRCRSYVYLEIRMAHLTNPKMTCKQINVSQANTNIFLLILNESRDYKTTKGLLTVVFQIIT